jgi:ABC-type thiamin/hydroxymethylpyrimidine transport system permease subunit
MLIYYGILFVGTMIQPVLALVALLASLVSRTLRQALLGGVVAAGSEILFARLTEGHSTPIVIGLMAGVTLCSIALLIRRELGVPALFEKGRCRE